MKTFRTFQLAVQLYRLATTLKLSAHLRDQLLRAAASAALNIAEGAAKASPRDRARFFEIAYASTREVQAVLALSATVHDAAAQLADALGGSLYRLVQNNRREG